jgi:phosphohistidine swiveling domain-containing protein
MKHEWLELAHEKKGHIYPPALYWGFVPYIAKLVGAEYGLVATWHFNHEFSYMTTKGSLSGPGKVILKNLKEDKGYIQKIVDTNEKYIPLMLEAAKTMTGDLSDVPGEELYKRWQEWYKHWVSLMEYSGMGTVMEMEDPMLTKELEGVLAAKLGEGNEKIGDYFQVLTTANKRTVAGQEEIDLLRLRKKQIGGGLSDDAVSAHVNKYSWIAFGYDGPGWEEKNIRNRLEELPSDADSVDKLIAEKEGAEEALKEKQRKAEEALGLDEDEKHMFKVLRTLGFWKFERKFMNQQAHEMMEDLIKEIAKRNSLSVEQVKMITPDEIEEVLVHGNVSGDELNERIKECVVLYKEEGFEVLSGDAVKGLVKEIKESIAVDTDVTELKGNTAYPGYAKGVVRQVDVPEEMSKLQEGDILISASTSPHILPAMKRAGAIVTDSGGITCHAAIVAREIKVPTVIGTKMITKVCRDGDVVEVDAGKGIVRIIERK